jgi:hypothetical protein
LIAGNPGVVAGFTAAAAAEPFFIAAYARLVEQGKWSKRRIWQQRETLSQSLEHNSIASGAQAACGQTGQVITAGRSHDRPTYHPACLPERLKRTEWLQGQKGKDKGIYS